MHDSGQSGDAGAFKYTLIDDMETTTHGPIELAGIMPPESPGYWFNFGGTTSGDTLSPPNTMFTFSALPTPTTTLMGKKSTHAAYELCALNGQYDVCGIGLEFAQVPETEGDGGGDAGVSVDGAIVDAGRDGDAGALVDAAVHDAGVSVDAAVHDAAALADAAIHDAGEDGGEAGVPMMTVPFDISQYKGITFWGKTTAGDAGSLDVKVQFPDTDTDPRGGVCNSGVAHAADPADLGQCFNSYAEHVTFTGDWQQFTVMFSDLAIDPTYGYQMPNPWSGTNVYALQWQGQDNNAPDSGTVVMDLWVDDVYFIQ